LYNDIRNAHDTSLNYIRFPDRRFITNVLPAPIRWIRFACHSLRNTFSGLITPLPTMAVNIASIVNNQVSTYQAILRKLLLLLSMIPIYRFLIEVNLLAWLNLEAG